MLLAVLLHLLIFHLLTASDAPKPRKDTEYKIKHIKKCPDAGYFFKREATTNALEPYTCNLCFCQGDHVAVCWKRDNRRCDKESFHYQGVAKKRDKRSPGFTDIFFRDASRDVFNKNTKTQCKPFESSFSEDCPPADWCTGCTVCDCDANGHWDCHLLSFCPDDSKKSKKHRGQSPPSWLPFMEKTKEKLIKHPSVKKSDTRVNAIKHNGPPKKPSNNKSKVTIQNGGKKKHPQPKHFVKKKVPQKSGKAPKYPKDPLKMKKPIKYTKVTTKRPNTTKKTIQKNIATHRPIQIKKSNKVSLETELARKMMKSVMQNLKKTVSAKVKNMELIARQNAYNVRNEKAKTKLNQTKNNAKTVNKRQLKKPNAKPSMKKPNLKTPVKKTKAPLRKPIYRAKGKNTTRKPCTKQYARHKRDVSVSETHGSSTDSNATDAGNSSATLTVIPMFSNPLIPYDFNSSVAKTENTTRLDNKYYKYTVVSEEPKTKVDVTIGDIETTQFNRTETIFNLLGEHNNSIVSPEKRHIKHNEANNINITGTIPNQNGLKFSKWSNLKVLKNKTFISKFNFKHQILTKLMSHTAKTISHEDKNRTHGKKIERKHYRKYNIVKLLHSKCMTENCKINNKIKVQLKDKIKDTPTKIKSDFHGYITNVLKNCHKHNSAKRERKPGGVLKYLKGILNKIFKGQKSAKMNKHQMRIKLIETLCEHFGPCSKVNRQDEIRLNSKLTELDKETTKILKTVRIIKGLLKLFELPEPNQTANSNNSKGNAMNTDIQKLNLILKGGFSENIQEALTATQKTQIGYIKRNTQDFIESVSKFTSLLNELIAILTKDNANGFRNKTKNYFMNKNLSKDPFESLRNLRLRFHLVQNPLMKQIYEELNNFKNKINEKTKVSETKDYNNSVAIENISRNIIHNLRKLKHLAQTVSFREKDRGRTKRSASREDDAMEYLLMIMEYLIKQYHPLDAEPVSDGIDLLIEAIKNAPDIKTTKKKVLDYTPAIYIETSTTASLGPIRTGVFQYPESISDDGNPSDSDTNDTKSASGEGRDKTKLEEIESNMKKTKDFVDIATEDEKEFEDKFQYDRRAESEKTEEITEIAFFRKLGAEDNIMSNPESASETTTVSNTIMPLEMETMTDKLYTSDDFNVGKTATLESNNLDKSMDYNEAGRKKIEEFSGDLDEESFLSSTTTTETDIPTSTPTYYSPQLSKAKPVTKMIPTNIELPDSDDKTARLKWIEENFGKESEKGFIDFEDVNSSISITPVTAQSSREKTIHKIDDGIISRKKGDTSGSNDEREKAVDRGESGKPQRKKSPFKFNRSDDDLETKKTRAKLSAEEVMFRKQMELLNSLDYGTEKAEVFETESKDSNVDEPNTADSFPAYYV